MNTRSMATGFRKYLFCATLFTFGLLAGSRQAVSAVTLSAADVSGQAGQTASVPIALNAGSAQILNIQFNLTVVPQGGAPAITAKLTYTANTPPGSPGLTDDSTLGQFLVGYPSDISPPLTGTVVMGTLGVPIPAGATGSYQVQVLNPSALDPNGNDVTVTGQAATVSLGPSGPTLSAGSVDGEAGQTASVPIALNAGSAQILNIQFNLTVVPQGGAPAIAAKLTYTANTPPGAPGLTDDSTLGQFLVGYPSDISPPLTGTVAMGTLGVPIPAGATGSYQVQVLNPSALDPNGNDVTVTGQAGTIMLAAGPPTATPTNTSVPSATSTSTPVAPSATPTHGASATPTQAATKTPTQAATATAGITAHLGASLSASATTLTLDNAGSLPDSGTVVIGNERIAYTGKSGNQLTGLTRGVDGTTATTHAAGDLVTLVGGGGGGGNDSDGCQIGATASGSAWLLLIPAVGLLVARRRRR